jgi:hypothetical protein
MGVEKTIERNRVDEQNKKVIDDRVEMYRYRYLHGLDLWTGHPLLTLSQEAKALEKKPDPFYQREVERVMQTFDLLVEENRE